VVAGSNPVAPTMNKVATLTSCGLFLLVRRPSESAVRNDAGIATDARDRQPVPMTIKLSVVDGDLLDQQVDAIVNAWNRNVIPWWLLLPQGVSGAIKRRGGVGPFRELGYRPMPLGSVRLTLAGRLPFKAIIHVAGINMLWRASEDSIRNSVDNAVAMAVSKGFRSLAFPIIGAGSGGFDEAAAEAIMLSTLETLPGNLDVLVVRFKPAT
jgi:O-acetyl-ADP-ribose deacetylase (regulator of RNase III)